MILYFCRYAPAEILEAMDAETEYLHEEGGDVAEAEALLHPQTCSFAKAALGSILARDPEGVLFTSCCDSTRRLYDVVKRLYPDRFVYMMQLPVRRDDDGVQLYRQAVGDLIKAYSEYSGREFDALKLEEIMRAEQMPCHDDEDGFNGDQDSDRMVRIGLTGAKIPPSLEDAVRAAGAKVVFNASCSGQKNRFYLPPLANDEEGILAAFISGVFSKYPCMRMISGSERADGLKKMAAEAEADGIIYHTIKFCDNYAYEYAGLLASKQEDDLMILKVETDYTSSAAGQLSTRLEAFVEMIGGTQREMKSAEEGEYVAMDNTSVEAAAEPSEDRRYSLGVDSGSTSTNAVVLAPDGSVAGTATVPTGAKIGLSAELARKLALEAAGLSCDEEIVTIATGYGRAGIDFAGEAVTEITCHARGAHRLCPEARTIIDIGGQDSKVIKIDELGKVADFAMNDKCAAGTGRFLEKTAGALGVSLDDIGGAACAAQEDITISSMCTVFAESEVVSLIADGRSEADILNGLCLAVARRNEALLKRVGAEPPYMMTGGVARNEGVVKAFESLLGAKVFVPDEPELAGALGAAIFASEL